MTLMPVSKISVFGSRSANSGRSRWIGQRWRVGRDRRAVVDRLAEHVEDAAERRRADRHRDRRAGVDDLHAAHDAVGRRHGDGAHLVAADVLLHLGRRRLIAAPSSARYPMLERVVDLRQVLGLELDVEHRADDLHDLADVVFAVAVAMGSQLARVLRVVGAARRRRRRAGGPPPLDPDRLALQGRRAADDLRDLLRDLRLARAVVGPLEHLQNVAGVVGRVLHRRAPRAWTRPPSRPARDTPRCARRAAAAPRGWPRPTGRECSRARAGRVAGGVDRKDLHRRRRRRERRDELRRSTTYTRVERAAPRIARDQLIHDLRRVLRRRPVADVGRLRRHARPT